MMDIHDNTEFRNRLVVLAELFDLKLAPTRQALYFEALRDLSFEAVASALNQAAKMCKFFPRPAELRALAVGDVEDATEGAWMAFRKAMTAVGGYASLITTHAVLGETITAVFGSWPDACALELSPEMWAAKRKEFGRVFRVLTGRGLDGARYLAGICETQNAGKDAWKKFTPVALLEADGSRMLGAGEVDTYRAAIAAVRSELTRIDAGGFEQLIAAPRGETA
jgi:hypothetical protein